MRGVEGFRVMVPNYSASVVYLRLGRAGRTTRTLLLFSESRGHSPRALLPAAPHSIQEHPGVEGGPLQ